MAKNFSKIEFPTVIWRQQMVEELEDEDLKPSDIKFNEEILQHINLILSTFVTKMENIDGQNFPEIVKKEVIHLVEQLNKIGGVEGKFGNFIETLEREDLCDFIDQIILLTGYNLQKFEDLTEDYREW